MKNELATKKESFDREGCHKSVCKMEDTIKLLRKENIQVCHLSLQKLQKDSSKKEEEWCTKNCQMEEEIKILTEQNTDLQVCHLRLQELQKDSSNKVME